MKSLEVLELLESLASDQWGIITTAQAEREGVSRLQISRLSERGVLVRVRRGIYLLPSAEYGPLTDIRSAWVSLGADRFPVERLGSADDVYVSHESAALIHKIGDLIPGKLFFSTPFRKQTGQKDIHVYNHRDIESNDMTLVGGLPVTSVERTVSDLASNKIEFNYLATLVTDALRKEGVRMKDIAGRLDKSALSYGFQSGRQLLHACQEEAESDEDGQERYERVVSNVVADLDFGSIASDLDISALSNYLWSSQSGWSKAFEGTNLIRLFREQMDIPGLREQMANFSQFSTVRRSKNTDR